MDLYTLMWAAIGTMLTRIQHAQILDDRLEHNSDECWKHVHPVAHNYTDFLEYLTVSERSPIKNSLKKIGLEPDRWPRIIEWSFCYGGQQLDDLVGEAGEITAALDELKKAKARQTLELLVSDSLMHQGMGGAVALL